jgi:hypothetical protein
MLYECFNDPTELLEKNEIRVFMTPPTIEARNTPPTRCLCGCIHFLDFTPEQQAKHMKTKGKYRYFFNTKHITYFTRNYVE